MSTFTIDDNVPMPLRRLKLDEAREQIVNTALQLTTGQSFVFITFDPHKPDKEQTKLADNMVATIRTRCKRAGDKRTFAWRKQPDGNYRIWRTS